MRIKDLRLKEEESDVQIFSLNISDTTTSLHATSVCWNSSGTSILASTGSGYVGVLDIRREVGGLRSLLQAHTTPCYGAMFTKGDSDCITWSSDGNIKLWKDINVTAGITYSLTHSLTYLLTYSLTYIREFMVSSQAIGLVE